MAGEEREAVRLICTPLPSSPPAPTLANQPSEGAWRKPLAVVSNLLPHLPFQAVPDKGEGQGVLAGTHQ